MEAVVSTPKLLSIALAGYDVAIHPRLTLRRSDGSELPESPVDFSAVGADGQYLAEWTPSEAGDIAAHLVVYEDAGHTVRSVRYDPASGVVRVWNRDQDTSAQRVLGLLGENSRVVVTADGPSGDPAAAKVYLYATEADAQGDVNRIGEIDVVTAFNPTPLPDVLVRRKIS